MPALKKNPDGSPHVHAYRRVVETKPNAHIRYACTHPDCTSVVGRNLLKGKRTLCGICKTEDCIFDYENLRREIPRCSKCSNTKKAAAIREKQNVLEELFGSANQ